MQTTTATIRTAPAGFQLAAQGAHPEDNDPIEDALLVLRNTSDGDDLDRSELAMVEAVANYGYSALTAQGLQRWKRLVDAVASGTYVRPWLHQQEHLSRDHQGYVYWRGARIEHYSFRHRSEERAAAESLAQCCRLIERRGETVTSAMVSAVWDEIRFAIGMPVKRVAVLWAVTPTGTHAVLCDLAGETTAQVSMSLDAASAAAALTWKVEVRSILVVSQEDLHDAASALVQDRAWARRAWVGRPFWASARNSEGMLDVLSLLNEGSLPTRAQIRAHVLADALADCGSHVDGESGPANAPARERGGG
jgi:hypothetical protein